MDVSETDAPLFADAVALEIPYNATSSSIAMGNQFEPVNILFWRANARGSAAGTGQVQNIVSGGAGTVQKSPDSDALVASQVIAYSQTRAGGSWTVIIKRPLSGTASPAGNIAALTRGKNYRITFAQWDGGNQERNGVKMVAGSWQTLFVQ
jgi:DMSO reductase family type II enzyme heme b subunit